MINLEVIAEGHFDALHFSRISSSRELCNKQRVKPTSNNASLFGGLCYDCPIDYSSSEINNRNYLDFLVNDTITRKGISYLPGSKTEIETIYKISKDKGWKASLYTDNKGTERDYRKLQGKDISVLHLSTHGFALGHSSIKDFDEPMRRCGLLLAGAQPAWNGETHNSDEDGILLGEEIANVPIENNDIVILSACETGLGELTPDGVWGLQRAFKKAGANSILMSLWKVNDLSTRMFMEEFYRNYLSGMNKSKSLLLARNYIINFMDKEGNRIFENPYYWASFILLDALD
jgi:CHAT domain-containing protein